MPTLSRQQTTETHMSFRCKPTVTTPAQSALPANLLCDLNPLLWQSLRPRQPPNQTHITGSTAAQLRASQTGQIFPEFLLVSCNLLKCRNSRVQNPKPHNRQGRSIFESPDYLSSTWASHQTISHLCGQVATMGQMVKSPCLLWKWGKW